MAIEVLSLDSAKTELADYSRVFGHVDAPVLVKVFTDDDCIIDVSAEKPFEPFLDELFGKSIAMMIANIVKDVPRIDDPRTIDDLMVFPNFTVYKFATILEFASSIHKSWWYGDFFLTGDLFFEDLRGESHDESIWEQTKFILNNLNRYKSLYCVMEYPLEIVFLLE
jgi:hypothetical protein